MLLPPQFPATKLDACDVIWTIPSADAAGSMPIGNGEVVLNVWVEGKTGDLLFYIARTDALSEISRFLKLGRIRVHFARPVFKQPDFKQQLQIRDGVTRISGGSTSVLLFVDSGADVVHVVGDSARPIGVTASVECWRNTPRALPKEEKGSAWSVHDAPFPLIESADVFLRRGNSLGWYHRNETSVVPKLWANQSLTGLKGTFDPILHRTFGGWMEGKGFVPSGDRALVTKQPLASFDLKIATASAQTATAAGWIAKVRREAAKSDADSVIDRTTIWWRSFWARSWVFVDGDGGGEPVPANKHPLLKGRDQNGQNVFPGTINDWSWSPHSDPNDIQLTNGFVLIAKIQVDALKPGRIFDKLTPGKNDGFLFDTYPGDGLRLIVGDMTLTAPHCLQAGHGYDVEAYYDAKSGAAHIFLDGKTVATRPAQSGSPITRGYNLQRYVQACQGRGAYPIKFNGGFYTVEPKAMGKPFDPDFRNWGDSHWWQNVRHMYHPMLEQGDFEMMDPLFRMYESVVPLAESRSKAYHGAKGAYFPETMTVFGTYSGGDYGWDRTGHLAKDVLCPWWQYAWNQGPELVALMLDRWDYTRDQRFLEEEVIPMAESVLRYFDTRFKKDANGRIVLDPTQVVETYWEGVVNDMPSTAGLIAITSRINALNSRLLDVHQRDFFKHMQAACPELPLESPDGVMQLAPAQKYTPKTSNVENGELYAVWPFQVVSLAHPKLLSEAKAAYAKRLNHLDVGWGYDGNVAALLGMADETARILKIKCANSRDGYRWPATWGPNFDWLPDQNHGGNLLNTANLMLLQSDPIEQGGAIRLLPAWPKNWDVDFRLHAAGNTTVHCIARHGRIVELEVTPKGRMKNIVFPEGWPQIEE